jgi:ketosteroid isomerase-like protein
MTKGQLTLLLILVLSLAITLKVPMAEASGGELDKAYPQAIWDSWATRDTNNPAKYYLHGPNHLFFGIAPVKYDSWDEYKAGAGPLLQQFSSLRFALNDDLQIHPVDKNTAWVDATVNMDATSAQGENQKMVLRWTAILEKEGDKWLIVHEHVSAPLPPAK